MTPAEIAEGRRLEGAHTTAIHQGDVRREMEFEGKLTEWLWDNRHELLDAAEEPADGR